MIFGRLELGENALHTNNDSYVLHDIKAVSNRRPLLSAGVMIAGACGLFAGGFADILYEDELWALGGVALLSVVLGLLVGRLSFSSRELTGSAIADVVWGTHGHLKRKRREIAEAVDQARKREGGKPEVRS